MRFEKNLIKGMLVFMTLVLLLSSVKAQSNLTDGIVRYYKLDETSGTSAEEHVHGLNNGTYDAAIDLNALGVHRTGIRVFDDNDKFTYSNDVDINFHLDENYTTSFWIYVSNLPSGDQWFLLNPALADRTSGDVYYQMQVTSTGALKFQIGKDGLCSVVNTDVSVDVGDWMFILITFNDVNDRFTFHVNGTSQFTSDMCVPGSGQADLNGTTEWYQLTNGNEFNLTIDEISYWDRILSQGEIDALYNNHHGLPYPFDMTAGLIAYYPFEIDVNNYYDGTYNMTNSGCDFNSGYMHCDSADTDWVQFDDELVSFESFTINYFAKCEETTGECNYLSQRAGGAATWQRQLLSTSTGDFVAQLRDNDGSTTLTVSTTSPSLNLNEWYFYSITWDNTTKNLSVYFNATLIESTVNLAFDSWSDVAASANHRLGGWFGGGGWASDNESFRDMTFYDYTMSGSIIQELYSEQGNPLGTEPFLNIVTDLANTANYKYDTLNITYNGTHNTQSDLFDCYLIADSVINITHLSSNITQNNVFVYDSSSLEKNVTMQVNCTGNNVSDSTAVYVYQIDSVQPDIETPFINNSVFIINETVETNFTFTDPNLFAYNISFINRSANQTVENIFATNLTETTYTNISSRVYTGEFNATIRTTAWDSHTKNKLKRDYKITEWTAGFRFDEVQIQIDDEKKIKNKSYKKKKDRYEFTFEYDKTGWQTHYVDVSPNSYYLQMSPWRGHIVDLTNKKWIDWESKDYSAINVWKYDNDTYIVEVDVTSTTVTYSSIGDLNEIVEEYFFYVSDCVEVWTCDDWSLVCTAGEGDVTRTCTQNSSCLHEIHRPQEQFNTSCQDDCAMFLKFKSHEFTTIDDNPQHTYAWVFTESDEISERPVVNLSLVQQYESGAELLFVYNDLDDKYENFFDIYVEDDYAFNITQKLNTSTRNYCTNALDFSGTYRVYNHSFETCVALYQDRNATKPYLELGYILIRPVEPFETNWTLLDYMTGYVWTSQNEPIEILSFLDDLAYNSTPGAPSTMKLDDKWFTGKYEDGEACLDLYFPGTYQVRFIIGDLRAGANYDDVYYSWKDVDVELSKFITITNSTNYIQYYVSSWDVSFWSNVSFIIWELVILFIALVVMYVIMTMTKEPWGAFKIGVVVFIALTALHMIIKGFISGISDLAKILKYL